MGAMTSAAADVESSLIPFTVARSRVVGLVRVSSASQAEEGRCGLARQHTVIRATIEQKDLDCIRTYELKDVSGTDVLSNPGILEILEFVRLGIVQGIVVADLDRLFRPDCPTDFAILQVFKDSGAVIYSGDIEYDLSSKHGLLFSHIRSAISGYELSLMKERQQGAKEEKRKAGKCPTNRMTLPLGVGYDRPNERFFWTPEIVRVQELFRLYDCGGIRNYCELQRRTGINHATVRVILRNPIYTGWRIIHSKRGEKRTSKSGKTYRVKVERSAEEVIRVRVLKDPAVSEEVFERVGREMARTKLNHIERFRADMAVNLVAGIGVCGHCGEPLFCSSGKRADGSRKGYYQCKRNHYLYKSRMGGCKQPNLRQADVDRCIIGFTGRVLTDTETLASIISESFARRSATVVELPSASPGSFLADLKRREERLLAAYEGGVITVDELRSRRAELRREIDSAKRLADRRSEQAKPAVLETSRLIVKAALRFTRIEDRRAQKKVIEEIFSEIHLKDGSLVSVRFRDSMLCPALPGVRSANETVNLVTPVLVVPETEKLVPGQRRCFRCAKVKATSKYYRSLNTCNECRNEQSRLRYRKRKVSNLL